MIHSQTFRSLGCTLAFCATATVAGQTVTSAGNSVMQFEDGTHGVSFEYPSRWSFAVAPSFYSPLAITSEYAPLRGDVSVKGFPGIAKWPVTDLDGAEFGYAERDSMSSDECRRLASLASNDNGATLDRRTIGGVVFSHGRGANGGMSHEVEEDIYTTSSGNGCLLFDLAVHYLVAPSATQTPRSLSAHELAEVSQALNKILLSVRVERAKPAN